MNEGRLGCRPLSLCATSHAHSLQLDSAAAAAAAATVATGDL